MTPHGFPFAALVGLDTLKMALQLGAIDRRLSVLVRGDKGAGKSTAARGLIDLLEVGAPFVTLPIGATDDRLLGGLDIDKALKGEPALKPGLLHQAHGGVLYVDEVNLLPDHLADALLDAVASGLHVVEREGFSATEAVDFVLVGSMNPEEGALRPQLLDRFAFAVDVSAPNDPATRCDVVERRLAYDAAPAAFSQRWLDARVELAERLQRARVRLMEIEVPRPILALIADRVTEHDVRSLRADLAIVRGGRALAAFEGGSAVEPRHVEAVLPLVLSHRASSRPNTPRSTPSPAPPESRPPKNDSAAAAPSAERVFAPVDVKAPRLVVGQRAPASGSSAVGPEGQGGAVIGAHRTTSPSELDTRATVRHTLLRTGAIRVAREDLHERVRLPQAGTRYIFVVDSSGSHALQERMRAIKGAVNGMLDESHTRRDEIVVIVCRGAAAQVLLEPTTNLEDAVRALEYLPTGGRTPLAHALELAAGYVTDTSAVVLLTDGHANVAYRSDDPWADALSAARAIGAAGLVIDSESTERATGHPAQLADAMGVTCVRLEELGATSVLQLLGRMR